MAVAIVTSFVANKLTDGEVDTLGTHLGTHRRRWQDYPAEERLGRGPDSTGKEHDRGDGRI